jgi:pimeloyl-ACP methyl ester carboxylesterase
MKRLSRIRPLFVLALLAATSAYPRDLNLIENPGFENGSVRSVTDFDSCRFEVSGKAFHAGKKSMLFSPLKEGSGVRIDASSLAKPGFTYAFGAWFRNAELGWGQVDLFLYAGRAGKDESIPIGRVDCNEKNWKAFSGLFTVPPDADPSTVRIVIKTAWGLNAFFMDDVELRPSLQIAVEGTDPVAGPILTLRLGPADPARAGLLGRLEVFGDGGKPVASADQPLNAPLKTALTPGFFRAAASLTDLDGRRFETENTFCTGEAAGLMVGLGMESEALLADADKAPYRGWIRYLQYLVSWYGKTEGAGSERALRTAYRLSVWTRTIRDNPSAIDTLSGVREWAYGSRADDSGQPFKIAIPTGYDKNRTYPLVVVMHGYGGNHMEYSGGVASNPDFFELDVLGRARGGGYTDLSEADVLDAVDYVKKHWRIDDDRIHLTGASMGGGGTFKLSTRYPDRWASGRPVCGYGTDLPIRNALTVPLYSTHSVDDPTVPVLGSRATLRKLADAGGRVVIDETNGLQHAAWNYTEGNNRAAEWSKNQVRPSSRDVRRIDFTALDRKSCSAFWLRISEWGNDPIPARFNAVAGPDNRLYLRTDNIQTLRIRVPDSPFDRSKDLAVSVNGAVFVTAAAPLPDSLFINREKGIWSVSPGWVRRPAFALRTGGGVHNLYAGEPLLIVYGTDGTDEARKAMALAAEAASKSLHPMWAGDNGDVKDGVPSHHNLYSRLKIKADTAVTPTDLAACHLVLIGRQDQNRLVAKMAGLLPVRFDGWITCSDGKRIPAGKAVMGVYHYNPLAPHRLIYWVSAERPEDYRPNHFLLRLQDQSYSGPDLLVVQDDPPKIVQTRSFTSRWDWNTDWEGASLLTRTDCQYGNMVQAVAEAERKAAGADFVLAAMTAPPLFELFTPGSTRWSDVAVLDQATPIAVFSLKGSELLDVKAGFSSQGSGMRFFPEPKEGDVIPGRTYRVAMEASFDIMQRLINLRNRVPADFELTDMKAWQAVQRYLFESAP